LREQGKFMGQPLRVLIVDDSEDDATLLQYTLDHGGYEVTCEVVETPDTHAFLKVARGLKEKTFFGKFGVLILTKTKKGQNGV